jgi:hypothetical protein
MPANFLASDLFVQNFSHYLQVDLKPNDSFKFDQIVASIFKI